MLSPNSAKNLTYRLTAFIGTSLMKIFRLLGFWLGAVILRVQQRLLLSLSS